MPIIKYPRGLKIWRRVTKMKI